MRNIVKGREPKSLTEYRKQRSSSYAALDTSVKLELQKSLLWEQGALCCYCMSRISEEKMHIEHWLPQWKHPGGQLDYANLLASCNSRKHCGARKADSEVKFNPADRRHNIESVIRYLKDGTIESEDAAFNKQLDDVLGLNDPTLKIDREREFMAAQKLLGRKRGKRTADQIKKLMRSLESRNKNGEFQPYSGVALYILRRHWSMQ